MLQLILGRAGSGKTEYVFNSIKKLIDENERNILLITPEQFSFVAERRLLEDLGESKVNEVENTSFSRLADEISSKYGANKFPVLSKGSKAVMMNKALEAVSDSLVLFKHNVNSVSFINSVIKIYDEMKSCRVSLDDIEEAEGTTERELLKNKLHDIRLIIGMYDALINDKFYDPANELTRLYNKLLELSYFKGRTVFIDGFSGFVAQEYKILEVILKQADKVYITFCSDSFNNTDKFNLFSYVNSNIAILKDVTNKAGVEFAEPSILKSGARFKNEELKKLEENLYFNMKKPIDTEVENIRIYKAKSIYDECDSVSSNISKLLRNGYRASDIAVIVRDFDKYESELAFSFEKYNIPFFNDERQNILSEPLIMFVNFLLRTLIYSFRSEDIFSLLKTGLTSLEDDNISELENYVYMWSISGSRWKSEFNQSTKGFSEEISENDAKRLESLNKSRNYIAENLSKLQRKCKNATSQEIAKAIYYSLLDFSVDEKLKELAVSLDENGKSALAYEQERIWDLLMSVLDELASVSGSEIISVKEFYRLFHLILSNEDLGVIPAGLDNVQLGSADRMRCNNPRVVFILGANEGEFPQAVSSSGILSESDRAALINSDFKLYSYGETLNAQEKYFAYMAASSACEKLFVSYRITNGLSACESSLIDEILQIFPKLTVESYNEIKGLEDLETDANAFEILAEDYNLSDTFISSLNDYFSSTELYLPRLKAIQNTCDNTIEKLENTQVATELFGKYMTLSASRIDDYYNCAFRYFCKFGLNARPRKKVQLDPMQTGTVIHYVLEQIIKEKGSRGLSELSAAEIKLLVNKHLEYYLNNLMGDTSSFTPRFKYQFMRLSKMLVSVCERLKAEFEQSDFEAKAFELRIEKDGAEDTVKTKTLTLPSGGTIEIRGAIDRVDTFEQNGEKYVRVVDYKSGNKHFKLSDILYGLNLQMFIYLFTLAQSDSVYSGKPSGVLYMHSSRKLFSVERGADLQGQLEKSENDLYKMKGLVLNDSENEIAKHMEKNISGYGKYIPVYYSTKSGEFSGNIASLAELGAISEKIDNLIIQMGASLQNGKIVRNPVNGKGHEHTCEFCDYSTVCKNKIEIENKEISDYSNEEVIKIIRKELDDAEVD